LTSRPFTVTGDYFRLLLAGGEHPATCRVRLEDATTGEILTTIHPRGETALTERFWDVRAQQGREVVMVIEDNEVAPGGWIAVDGIEEFTGPSPVVDGGEDRVGPRFSLGSVAAWPNPFNARTEIVFEAREAGRFRVEIFDPAGRRVWTATPVGAESGEVRVAWDGRDDGGRSLPSGVYLVRVVHGGGGVAEARLTLVK
jgi:hypothetical protein